MQKIHFTVFSQAYYVDTKWGFGCPSGGIKRMGDIFHNYNIPITWLLSPQSARCEQDLLTEFHEKYGDEAAMMIRFDEKHHSTERQSAEKWSVDEARKIIKKQKEEIEKYLPWAKVKIAGQGIKTQNIMQAVLEEGFIGFFGHCYCQIGTDSITDYGMPWGSFSMRPSDYHLPSRENETGLIAFEWTQRDLTRSFHTVFPELWSTDPNDVERGGVCTDTNVEWWKRMFEQYERALPLNENGIWFQFHQEAHEMTWGEVCYPMTEQRVIFTADMMDTFLEWLVKRESVNFLTATKAAELYLKLKPKGNIPMYMPSAWTPVLEDMPFWQQIKNKTGYSGHISKHAKIPTEELYNYLRSVNEKDPEMAMKNPPWSDSFFFYDHECQMVFDIGRIQPIAILNYLNYEPDPDMIEQMKQEGGGGAPGFYLENIVPIPKIDASIGPDRGSIFIEVANPKKMDLPYGVFLWKSIPEYKDVIPFFEKRKATKKSSIKISPDQGVFLRFNLKPGNNIVSF